MLIAFLQGMAGQLSTVEIFAFMRSGDELEDLAHVTGTMENGKLIFDAHRVAHEVGSTVTGLAELGGLK